MLGLLIALVVIQSVMLLMVVAIYNDKHPAPRSVQPTRPTYTYGPVDTEVKP